MAEMCISEKFEINNFFESQNSVHTKQFEYDEYEDEETLNEQHLESVLKKCQNITKVDFGLEVNSSVLSLIGRYCPNIKSLTYYSTIDSSDENVLSFFRDNGHKLEDLYCTAFTNYDEIKILILCPNVKKIRIGNTSLLPNEKKEFLPKLEIIESNISISSKNLSELKILSDKYSQTIKTLNVMLYDLSAKELKTCIECISRFENLKKLKLIYANDITQPIDDCLSLIGQKCNKLLKLDLSIWSFVPITERFFDIFNEFKAIKKLIIDLWNKTVLSGSVECFKHCKQLIDIDIKYSELTEDFFTNIELFVPKLQFLLIKPYKQFSDSFINSIHSMKNIQKVNVMVDRSNIFDSKYWYFDKCLTEVMLSPNGMNVKLVTDYCGIYQSRHIYPV